MKILSLFDGVSCARLAIEKNGIPIEAYYASEIDKYAIKVTQANRPDTVHVGSVIDIKKVEVAKGLTLIPEWEYHKDEIDLLIGGSPCQDLSIAKKDRKGLDGERSSLFWEYVRILNEVKPKYFILENVASMPQKDKDIISQTLGVQPVMINASLVSAQNRKRLFWVGKWDGDKYEQVEIPQPEDKGILLKDILESKADEKYFVEGVALRNRGQGKQPEFNKQEKANAMTSVQTDSMVRIGQFNSGGQGDRVYSPDGKSATLSALGGGRGAKTGLYQVEEQIRKLTPIECERLQCMPDNWTNPTGDISNSQRYKMCGNAFNVSVVAHIISYLK